ncbi:MAG: hypothetical protein U0R44_01090 [Candidatus Micrarchaeia archaeon]
MPIHKKPGDLLVLRHPALDRFKATPEEILLAVIMNHVLRKIEKDLHFNSLDKEVLFDTAELIASRVLERKGEPHPKSLDTVADEEIDKLKRKEAGDFAKAWQGLFPAPPKKGE